MVQRIILGPLGSGALDPGWWSMSLVLFSLAFAPPAIALGQQGSAPWTHYPHALFPFFSAVKITECFFQCIFQCSENHECFGSSWFCLPAGCL